MAFFRRNQSPLFPIPFFRIFYKWHLEIIIIRMQHALMYIGQMLNLLPLGTGSLAQKWATGTGSLAQKWAMGTGSLAQK